MRRAILLGSAVAAGCAAGSGHDALEPATSLAAAEAAFAAHAVREGMRAAFMANFADDGVLVRNGWTLAHPALQAQAASPSGLDWRPVFVEAARAGDLGISTGPWQITPPDPARPALHGQFVSVWRRAQGRWQVVADIGISHPGPELAQARLETRVAASGIGGDAASLAAAERAFEERAAQEGMRAALATYGSQRLRFYREGHAPGIGAASVLAASAEARAVRFTVQDAQVSHSGDLGFARGAYAGPADAAGVWLRAWRREDHAWRVALDVANATR